MSEPGSTVTAYAFSAPLTLCLDIRSPLAYLALQPAFDLADELGVVVSCLPFAVAPLKKPTPERPGDDRGTRHRRLRAEYLAHDINRYAKVRGLTIRNIYRAPDSSRFDAGLLWLNRHCPQLVRAYLQTAFEGYWKETLDIQAPGAVLELIRGLGPETADYAVDAARCADELAELRAALVAGGVFNVPSFVVDGQVFVGRAHVPMVRWLLTGRQGPAPV